MANNEKKNYEEKVGSNTKNVMTKYDKKVLERKQLEAKEKRNKKVFKISSIVALVAIMIGIASFFVVRHNNIYGEYIKVGDNKISKIEYDYYYKTTANNFITSYSSYLSAIGLDTSKSFKDQQYSADLTWDDYFAQGAVDLIKQTKAIIADGTSKEFKYDVTEDYNTYANSISEAASTNSVSVKDYYITAFGDYATESNLKSVIKEYLTASSYYEQLSGLNTPSDSEITAYYEENKDTYDSIDYRVLSVETEEAANEMLSKITNEDSFATLAKTYAAEAEKTTYATSDASLIKGAVGVNTVYSSWLYDSSRIAGDKTVLQDSDNNVFEVVYFIDRYYDEANKDTITQNLTSQKVSEYVASITANYTVTDNKNHLKYLSVVTEAASE